MIHIKKTILTLALLIAATTQAWATDYLYLDISSDGKSATICYGDPDGKPYLDPNQTWMINSINYWDINFVIRSLITTVTFDKSCQTFNGKSLKALFFSFFGLKTLIGLDNLRTDDVEDMAGMFSVCKHLATLDLSSLNTANVTNMSSMFQECEEMTTVDLSSFNTAKVINMQNMFQSCYELKTIYVSDDWSTAKVEKSTEMFNNCKKLPGYKDSGPEYWDKRKATLTTDGGYLTYKTPGTPVTTPATDATNTSLSLTQPTGNVTISVKYYDQAEFADGLAPAAITGVQASTADPIVTPGTPKTIGTSDVKMGTVMYHASQTALTDADLLALGTDDWSSDVPKATNLGTGDAYVYYYIQGAEPANVADRSDANTCSDSDIKATNVVKVTLIAPPTYDVVINTAGLSAEEAGKWSASPNTDVTPGETVTVTYTGTRKVIGVKAEKKPDTKYLKWDDSQKKLVATEIPATAIKVENKNDDFILPPGTYLVEGDVTIGGQFTLSGNVEMIIKDGAKLTTNMINASSNRYSLSVYGQANMSGELNVENSYGYAIYPLFELNIHSCKLNASSSYDGRGGFYGIATCNVYGGSVEAKFTGYNNGYGICNTNLNIYGGEVKAVSKGVDHSNNYGITGDNGTSVTVYGGKLWAECNPIAISSNVTLTKDDNYTAGKIETSADGTSWTEYSGTGTPDAPYVRVGYSSAGAD